MKKLRVFLCAAMLLLSSACSGGGGDAATGGNTGSGSADQLTVATGGQITTLDPGLSTETVNNYILRHTTVGLFKQNED